MNKKICLLTDSLSSGGAEKMVSNLSFSLSKKGYQVFIVSMKDKISYPFAGELIPAAFCPRGGAADNRLHA